MPHVEWLFRYGWYYIGVQEHWPALALAAGWVIFAATRRSLRSKSTRNRKGVGASIIILTWLAVASLHGLGTTQVDIAGPTTRYPFFWDSVIVGGAVGIVIVGSVLLAERMLTPAGSTFCVPTSIRVSVAVAGVVWAGVWVWVFTREALLSRTG